jgi:hypothetical protein
VYVLWKKVWEGRGVFFGRLGFERMRQQKGWNLGEEGNFGAGPKFPTLIFDKKPSAQTHIYVCGVFWRVEFILCLAMPPIW